MTHSSAVIEHLAPNGKLQLTLNSKKIAEISKNKKICKLFLNDLEVVYQIAHGSTRLFEVREIANPRNEEYIVKELFPIQQLNLGIYSILDWGCTPYTYKKDKAISVFWWYLEKFFKRIIINENWPNFKIKSRNSCLFISTSALKDLQRDLQRDVGAYAELLKNSLQLNIHHSIEAALEGSRNAPKLAVAPDAPPKRLLPTMCQQLAAYAKQSISLSEGLDTVLIELLPAISRNSKEFPAVRNTVLKESISILISEFENKLNKKTAEQEWQKLFENNKEILGMVLGLPVSFVSGTTAIGANGIEGTGEKITDFLVKTEIGGTFGLIEIKTADINVVKETPYRRNVFGLHSDIHDAVAQVVHQKEQFLLNFNMKKSSDISGAVFSQQDHPVGISCVVVAGMYPSFKDKSAPTENELNQRQGFERCRSTLNGVKIITFDEVLAGLRAVESFIK